MKAIYSCRLYRGSKNKAAIKAALQNPINTELVVQLGKYLDEDEVQAVLEEQEPAVQEGVSVSDTAPVNSEGSDEPVADNASAKQVVQVVDIHPSSEVTDTEVAGPAEVDPPEDPVTDESEDVVEETTHIDEVVASQEPAAPSLDTVQGQLNAVEDTCGVVRTKASGDELWIYYNDKKNLNNLMGAVIDSLSAAGYTQLEFNRLARTDNAIVFQIANISTEVLDGET